MNNLNQTLKWRLAVLLAIVLFFISIGLLLFASTNPQRIAAWQVTPLGGLDVAITLVLALLGMGIYGRGIRLAKPSTLEVCYLVAMFLSPLVLVGIWLSLDKIVWLDVLLPGVAWRLYILLQTLPAAIAVWNDK